MGKSLLPRVDTAAPNPRQPAYGRRVDVNIDVHWTDDVQPGDLVIITDNEALNARGFSDRSFYGIVSLIGSRSYLVQSVSDPIFVAEIIPGDGLQSVIERTTV